MSNQSIPTIVSQQQQVYTIDHKSSKQSAINIMRQYQQMHYIEHQSIYSALNALNKAINVPQFKVNIKQLFFDPEKVKEFNAFLYENNFEHSFFYEWLNQLGNYLLNYNKVPVFTFPKLNPIISTGLVNIDVYNMFIYHEKKVHTQLFTAVNLTYGAYGITK